MVTDDVGYGFSIGCLGGGIIHFFQGLFYAPRKQRLISALRHVRDRSPYFGGSIALWCGTYALVCGGLKYQRQNDDLWNYTIAGSATGFVLNMRGSLSLAIT